MSKRPVKDHSRLMCDVAKLLRTSYHEAIRVAIAVHSPQSTTEEDKAEAQWVLDKFVETNILPEYIADWFIDLMIGRVVHTDSKGHILNPPRGVRRK